MIPKLTQLLLGVCCLLTFATNNIQAQLYVNSNSPCSTDCDGSSWDKAFSDLQDALAMATSGDQIWVAQGTYTPHTDDRTVYFRLNDGVQLFGGFTGTESTLEERDFEANLTILSADLNGDDGLFFENNDENAHTIVYVLNVSDNTVLDGFTLKGGNANGTPETTLEKKSGGAFFNDIIWGTNGISSPQIRNCIFDSNYALLEGGGLFNSGSVGENYTLIYNCVFKNNEAEIGGAIYNGGNNGVCNPEIINTRFLDNNARQTGGGIYNFGLNGGEVSPKVTNCIFMNNTAGSAAGYYSLTYGGTSLSTLTNCTFYGNNATNGGALYLNTSADGLNEATITNSIFWGSVSGFDPHFHFSGDGNPQVHLSNSIIDGPDCDGLVAGDHQIDCGDGIKYAEDPLFVDAADGDFHVVEGSPAIDAGSNAAIEATGVTVDIDGEERIAQNTVDLGVDEWKMITDDDDDDDEEEVGDPDVVVGEASLSPLINPVGNRLYLLSKNLPARNYSYSIYDAQGRMVQSGTAFITPGQNDLRLEFQPSGIYFLKLSDAQTGTRFIKL